MALSIKVECEAKLYVQFNCSVCDRLLEANHTKHTHSGTDMIKVDPCRTCLQKTERDTETAVREDVELHWRTILNTPSAP